MKLKKTTCLSIFSLFLPFLVSCSSTTEENKEVEQTASTTPSKEPVSVSAIKQIKNSDGNYGGTLNEAKYGKGTPLNGEADIKNSEYFLDTDYYNLGSTQSRIMYTKYQTYQKTMAKSDGIACALMVLNRDGYDVQENNEEALVNKYEQLNNTNVYNKGVSAAGLKKLFESFDYQVKINEYARPSGYPLSCDSAAKRIPDYIEYVKGLLYSNKTLLIKIKLGLDYDWKLVVGIDEMNSTNIRDDVFILANPNDILDHKQDGYTILGGRRLIDFYMNSTSYRPSSDVEAYQSVVIQNKKKNPITRYYEEQKVVQERPKLHFYRNSFGSIYPQEPRFPTPYNGRFDNPNSVYFKFNDVYNYESTSTRKILSKFRPYNQSWNYTCGLASAKMVFSYYGKDPAESETNPYSEEGLRRIYLDEGRSITSGTNVKVLRQVLLGNRVGVPSVGYNYRETNDDGIFFDNFTKFKDYIQEKLSNRLPLICASKCTTVGHFTVCIGYDDMGTENIYDDVIIFADPADTNDHYQDGYEVLNATFYFSRMFGTSNLYHLQSFLYFSHLF